MLLLEFVEHFRLALIAFPEGRSCFEPESSFMVVDLTTGRTYVQDIAGFRKIHNLRARIQKTGMPRS